MNRNWTSKMLAAALFGVMLGFYIHHDYVGWSRLGRQAFLDHDVQRFDLYMAQPRPALLTVFGAIILAGGVFALYESIAIVFSAVWNRFLPENRKSGG